MIKKLLLLPLLLFATVLFAQNNVQKDSLLQIWEESTTAPEERMEALKWLIRDNYLGKAPDSCAYYGQLLMDFALEQENEKYQGFSHFFLGNAALSKGTYDSALESLNKALSIFESTGELKGKASTLNSLGIFYQYQGQLDQAIDNLIQATEVFYQVGDSVSTISPMMNMASIHEAKGDIQASMEFNQKALGMAVKFERRRYEGIARNNLGNNYKFFGDLPNASDQYLKSLAIVEEIGNTYGAISTLNNLGLLYSENDDYTIALDYLNRGLEMARSNGQLEGEAQSLSNLGTTYAAQKDYPKALESYQQALKIITDNQITFIIPYHLLQIGKTYMEMGQLEAAEKNILDGLTMAFEVGREEDIIDGHLSASQLYQKQGKWSPALSEAKKGLKIAEQSGYAEFTANLAGQLVSLYKHFGQGENALAMYELQDKLQDSLYNEENTRSLIRQEIQYRYRQDALQDSLANANLLAVQEAKVQRRNLISYFLLGILFLTLVSGGFILSRYRLIRQQKQIIQEEKNKSEAAYSKLREVDESKSRFFTNISHEFRTPLTVISGMSERLQGNDKAKGLIQRNTNHLLQLINQILDLRKLESGQLKTHFIQADVSKYLRYILESFHSLAASKNISLEFYSDTEPLDLDFDPEKLLRIVSNLLSNALKFTPEGGEVMLQLIKTPNHFQFSVQDTGAGIPESKLPYLFDRFYQVDGTSTRSGEGTGIGLTLVKELVELMSGKISVQSEYGKGSSFTVTLPKSNEAPVELDMASGLLGTELSTQAISSDPTSDYLAEGDGLPSMLIVEDNPDVMEYLITCLQGDFQLMFASDGQEGVEKAQESVPDIIISDVMMPKKNGFELCNELKADERTSHIPIVLLTAKADVESRIAGLERGADAYLAKPFNPRELDIQLKNLLAIRKRLQVRYASMEALAPTEDEAFMQEDAFILKLQQIVLDSMEEEGFGVPELCKKAAMSRTQLHNKIKSLTNKSTSQFIRSVRVKKATELLQNPDLNIGEVAMEIGINNLSYFSRIFSKETGLSPNKYREKWTSER